MHPRGGPAVSAVPYGERPLSPADSRKLIEEINRWCRRTGTSYNKLVTAARVRPSLRSRVLTKGMCVSVRVAEKLRRAMREHRAGISRAEHRERTRLPPPSPPIELPRVDREPCPYCGVRADVGCRHVWSAETARGMRAA